MDAKLEQFYRDAIEEKMNAKESFTAYDITTMARKEDWWTKHEETKEFVHNFMAQKIGAGANYKKIYVAVGGRFTAIQYCPTNDAITPDPSNLTLADLMKDDC